MLCLKIPENKYQFVLEYFADSIYIKRKNREEQLKVYIQKYANLLAQYCENYPLQWFNFFDFWQKPKPYNKPIKKNDKY